MSKVLQNIDKLVNLGQLVEAEKLLASSNLAPSYRLAIEAAIALKRGDEQKSEIDFLRAVEIDPENPIATGNLAILLFKQKKLKKALTYAETAHKKAPKNETFARIYAACLSDCDRNSEAVAVLEPYTASTKPSLEMLLGYAATLRGDMRAKDSLIVLERAKELYPENEEAERGLADAYAELDPKLAQRIFQEIEEKSPGNVSVGWNRSFVELRLRNFQTGWRLYDYGLLEKIGKIGRPLPPQIKCFKLITDLSDLNKECWTLFSSEQGLGDQVLFLSVFAEALSLYPKSIFIGEDRMLNLVQRSFPSVKAYSYAFGAALIRQQHRVNGVFPLGSLMKYFRTSEDSFVRNKRNYLIPDRQLEEKFNKSIRNHAPGMQLIGISWTGGFWERQKKTKSFDFIDFAKIMNIENCRFISLQYGDTSKEREYAKKNKLPITFIEGIDFKKNIDSWFALACACDRILSVSTALVHFAGAAGKRVDLLLTEFQSPFIWGTEEGDSLPYSDVTIHRKKRDQGVEDFLLHVRKSLI